MTVIHKFHGIITFAQVTYLVSLAVRLLHSYRDLKELCIIPLMQVTIIKKRRKSNDKIYVHVRVLVHVW